MAIDNITKDKINGLLLKGFSKEEIAKLLGIEVKELVNLKVSSDIHQNSLDFYSELQKDLAKLVLTEMGKENRDTGALLNSIKLQAELQEKKLRMSPSQISTRINKEYIYKRDEEIAKEKEKGLPIEEIAEKFEVGILSIKQAIDRYELNLPEELKVLNPTIISETIGLKKEDRIKVLNDALNNNLKRKEVREIVNRIKNDSR